MYMPTLARFTARDPLPPDGEPVLLRGIPILTRAGSQYKYANNNPTSFTDPSGMQVGVDEPYPSPPFPKPGEECVKCDNLGSFTGFPFCCTVTPKPKRTKAFPARPISPKDKNYVTGGNNKFCPPGTQLGSHGMGPCIGVVIQCPDGVAAFHFQATESPYRNILRYDWPEGCKAIVCGGEDEWYSNCLAKEVLGALTMRGIEVVGVTGADSCGAAANGTWYKS